MSYADKKKRFGRRQGSHTEAVSSILESVIPLKHAKEKAANYEFLEDWQSIVGKELAEVSTPERLNAGVLTVRVIDPVWIQEMSLLKEQIIQTIVDLGYAGAVSEIQFVSGNPKNFAKPYGSR